MTTPQENPLGDKVSNTSPAPSPSKTITLTGHYVTLVPVSPTHAPSLFPLVAGPSNLRLWDYMPFEHCPPDLPTFTALLSKRAASTDPVFYTILKHSPNAPPTPVGMSSYLRIDGANRVIEVGHLMFSPVLQRSPASTEAMYLMARYAFETLGYRRYEWKCHSLNAPSNRAAKRLGFTYEGTFRNALIDKWGRNRDTCWYSILDVEWEGRKRALEAWLDEGNFDGEGRQRKKLEEFR